MKFYITVNKYSIGVFQQYVILSPYTLAQYKRQFLHQHIGITILLLPLDISHSCSVVRENI